QPAAMPDPVAADQQSALSSWLNSVAPERIFCGVLGFFWLTYLWENYLAWRQYKLMRDSPQLPEAARQLTDDQTYAKARAYSIDKSRYSAVRGLWSQLLFTFILLAELMPRLWAVAGRHLDSLAGPDASRGQLPQSMVFLVYVMLLSFLIDLPWSVYKNFVLEARHGFNKQTPGFYAKDQLKSLLLSMAIGLPIAAALLWLIERGGPYFYVYAWLLASVVIFVLMLVYPSFIAPLFDTYEPLREGQLKQRIEDLAKRLEFPLTQLLVIEGSRRSAHSNAYLFGLWRSKRIVLFDTLIEGYQMQSVKEKEEKEREKREKEKAAEGQGEKSDEAKAEPDSAAGEEKEKEAKKGCNDDEILAVLGHELGHWSLGHNVSNIFISEVNLFLMFFAFGQLLNCHSAFAAFGFQQPAPLLLRLAFVLEFLLSPYNELLGFAMICLTRLFEFQADRFSVRLGFGQQLKTALIKLHTDNLSYPLFDPLYSAFNHSHPTADRFSVRLGFGQQLKTALIKLHTDNLSYPLFDPLYMLHRLAAIDQAEAEDEAKTK
uniref:Ste24 endopeptidase n=1 Tax=Macrostomum lignano TaxID=282301 RepID=A0A1I8JDT9_9PLAT